MIEIDYADELLMWCDLLYPLLFLFKERDLLNTYNYPTITRSKCSSAQSGPYVEFVLAGWLARPLSCQLNHLGYIVLRNKAGAGHDHVIGYGIEISFVER